MPRRCALKDRRLILGIIFVDGACEGSDKLVGSIGVIMSPSGRLAHHFSCEAAESFMKACEYSLNPIYELELLPMLVTLLVWRQLIKGCQVVFYGDNDAARASLIAGRASTTYECGRKDSFFICHS